MDATSPQDARKSALDWWFSSPLRSTQTDLSNMKFPNKINPKHPQTPLDHIFWRQQLSNNSSSSNQPEQIEFPSICHGVSMFFWCFFARTTGNSICWSTIQDTPFSILLGREVGKCMSRRSWWKPSTVTIVFHGQSENMIIQKKPWSHWDAMVTLSV